ncbi:hypothetical protein CBF56_08310 [Lactobacillus taiwanensis]|uniref:ABC transporter permease n=1 Tax=Lactobacillus taiwanensis TaxID=508451 RepID=A0A256L9W0_9LACO|nr:hypothetical protein CBF53_09455 [Lactobacillus taiwanensis]OYR90070.1 hypothetical protein CBF70_10515 [Lactobacillus taiwanensis]OYR91181.1 hypothetical protein CBF59_07190 [Lactobacillus taiwanensis]OYS16933.1 hypothetical protein CBF56_08310 [Lactobacillus taiwanensis]OYS17783.1 hypothetical protein CBF49_07175 [Lactobacillus taiwanensis]
MFIFLSLAAILITIIIFCLVFLLGNSYPKKTKHILISIIAILLIIFLWVVLELFINPLKYV